MKPFASSVLLGIALATGGCNAADPRSLHDSPEVSSDAAASSSASTAPAVAALGFTLYDIETRWRDQRGGSLALSDLAGPVQVVALVYTHCHGTCPLIVNEMKRIEASVPPGAGGDVGFVLISLDPSRDTPGRLAVWADDNHLDQARWTLLSGNDSDIREIAATLGVRYQVQPDGEVVHSNVITVLDRAGTVVHQQDTLGEPIHATSAIVARLLD